LFVFITTYSQETEYMHNMFTVTRDNGYVTEERESGVWWWTFWVVFWRKYSNSGPLQTHL